MKAMKWIVRMTTIMLSLYPLAMREGEEALTLIAGMMAIFDFSLEVIYGKKIRIILYAFCWAYIPHLYFDNSLCAWFFSCVGLFFGSFISSYDSHNGLLNKREAMGKFCLSAFARRASFVGSFFLLDHASWLPAYIQPTTIALLAPAFLFLPITDRLSSPLLLMVFSGAWWGFFAFMKYESGLLTLLASSIGLILGFSLSFKNATKGRCCATTPFKGAYKNSPKITTPS